MKQLNLKLITFTLLFGMLINPIFSQLKVKDKTDNKVEIGSVSMGSVFLMSCNYYKDIDKYLFSFKNYKYSTITDIKSFYLNEQSKNELYTLIKNELPKKSEKKVEIDLEGKKSLTLNFVKGRVQFEVWDGYNLSYSMSFNIKKIDKLFGITN